MQPAGSDRRRASRFNGRGRWSLVPAVLALFAPLALAALPAPPAQRAGSAAGAAPAVSSASPSFLLARFDLKKDVIHLSPAVQVVAIVGETLISEDLTCVTVGTLIHQKKLPWLRAGLACFLGIYIGDLTFFFLGRLAGQRLLNTASSPAPWGSSGCASSASGSTASPGPPSWPAGSCPASGCRCTSRSAR